MYVTLFSRQILGTDFLTAYSTTFRLAQSNKDMSSHKLVAVPMSARRRGTYRCCIITDSAYRGIQLKIRTRLAYGVRKDW